MIAQPLLDRIRAEASKQAWIILPLVGFNLVIVAVQLVSVMFVGHLGTLELSSAAIATSVCNVTGFSLLLGLTYALDTLCGQAYGAKQYHRLGILVQQAIFILAAIAVPISVLWFNMERVLLWFHQEPAIAAGAQRYARRLVPGLFAYAVLQPMVKFLQTQSRVLPLLWSSLTALVLHILVCWIFTYKLAMGNIGAAVALSVTNWLLAIFLVIAAAVAPDRRMYWSGFTMEVFQDVMPFFKLAIPSAVMICLEWWALEAVVLLAGVLPNPEIETSVLSVIIGIVQLWSIPAYGISAAASVRTSNELGDENPSKARFAFRVSVLVSIVYAVAAALVLFLLRNFLGPAFSSDSRVVTFVSNMIPLAAGFVVLDTFHSVGFGVASGCGWQSLAALVNIGAYYVIGLPLCYVLGFTARLKAEGLALGFLSGFLTQAVIFLVVAFTTNWEKQAVQARERLGLKAPLLEV